MFLNGATAEKSKLSKYYNHCPSLFEYVITRLLPHGSLQISPSTNEPHADQPRLPYFSSCYPSSNQWQLNDRGHSG